MKDATKRLNQIMSEAEATRGFRLTSHRDRQRAISRLRERTSSHALVFARAHIDPSEVHPLGREDERDPITFMEFLEQTHLLGIKDEQTLRMLIGLWRKGTYPGSNVRSAAYRFERERGLR